MGQLQAWFQILKDQGGSDLHINAGQPPRMRIHGELGIVPGSRVMGDAEVRAELEAVSSPARWQEFITRKDIDFALDAPGVGRFRTNYYVQQHGAAAAFRLIPSEITAIEALGLPPAVEKLAHMTRGLVLVTGPTGSGKSTTLASIIDRINDTYAYHIITIEDPIEFVHPRKKAVITQREVGVHSDTFSAALRAAVREDPDVIMVGEMRDIETISLALTAAEMGTLVFGTLHTNSAAKTIDRIIEAFPADQHGQARSMLAESLTAVVSQLLLRNPEGTSRKAVCEILLRAVSLGNLIRENNIPMLQSMMQAGKKDGMQLMDDGLLASVQANEVAIDDAYLKAYDKGRFEPLLKKARDAAAAAAAGDAPPEIENEVPPA